MNLPHSSVLDLPDPADPERLLPRLIEPGSPDPDRLDELTRFLEWIVDLQGRCPFTGHLHILRSHTDRTSRCDLLVHCSVSLESALSETSPVSPGDGENAPTVHWTHPSPEQTLITTRLEGEPVTEGPRWGSWSLSKNPGGPCGDVWAIWSRGDKEYFLVADGLGSGEAAREASRSLFRVLTASTRDDSRNSPADLMRIAHKKLTATRGVVAFLGRIPPESEQFEFCSVGNITALRIRANSVSQLVSHNGTLGYSLPELRNDTLDLSSDDHLLIHTDGIDPPVSLQTEMKPVLDNPLQAAAHLLYRFRCGNDDALAACVNPRSGNRP